MPDYLKLAINDVCKGEKISLNQFIVNALSEKVSKASKEDFLYALSQVPDNEPYEDDRL